MSIWRYDDERLKNLTRDGIAALYSTIRGTQKCAFCGTAMVPLIDQMEHLSNDDFTKIFGLSRPSFKSQHVNKPHFNPVSMVHHHARVFENRLRACPVCGWWLWFKETMTRGQELEVASYGGIGALKVLDLSDLSIPIAEVRAFLAARYDERSHVDPTVFEQTVGSVFKDLGYGVIVTARSGDDGIDVILNGPNGDTVGVQVKRYRDKIQLKQIRELTGALVVNGLTRGIFITTSDFTSGAQRTVNKSALNGKPVELVNADAFYSALQLAQIENYRKGSREMEQLLSRSLPLLGRRIADGKPGNAALY